MTVGELYWQWRDQGPSSNKDDIRRVLHFAHHVGREAAASALTETTISAYLAEIRAVVLPIEYRNHVVTIRAFLNYAVRSGALPFNPMRLLLPIWSSRMKRPHRRLMRPESMAGPQSLGAGLSSAERKELAEIEEELRHEGISTVRPRQLSECPPADEPCVWAGCRDHLGAEVLTYERTGTKLVKVNWPGVDVDEMPETCSLRAARRFAIRQRTLPDKAGFEVVASCEDVAALLNLTQERVRGIENEALAKLRRGLDLPA